jgi:hypothetical protein
VLTSGGETTSYSYDADGNLIETALPSLWSETTIPIRAALHLFQER